MERSDGKAPRRLVERARTRAPGVRGEVLSVVAEVPRNLRWFEGNFPGDPVLPGAAQLVLVHLWAAEAWTDCRRLARVQQLKLYRPIRPGDVVRVELERLDAEAPTLALRVARDGSIVTSATLVFDSF